MSDRANDSSTTRTTFQSLVDILHHRAVQTPNQLAYQFLIDGQLEGTQLTYSELNRRARLIAARLCSQSKRGDRALLMFPPGPDFLPAFFGCLYAGVIAIPLPAPDSARTKRTLPRLASVVRDAQASIALTTPGVHTALIEHLDEFSDLRSLDWITDQTDADFKSQSGTADSPFEEALGQMPCPSDIAFLQYTSGSTSAPKGVIVSHGNVLSQCRSLARASDYSTSSVTANWMPYFHDYGLIEGLLLPLCVGFPCYFMSPVAFIKRPIRWLEAIGRYRVTHSQAPNFAYEICLQKIAVEDRQRLDLSTWHSAANGAEPVRPETLRAFHEAFKSCGLRWESLAPAYGLAEATLVVSATTPGRGPFLLNARLDSYQRGRIEPATDGQPFHTLPSCGHVLDETHVEIVHPESRTRCAANEVGEIWVSGPSVTQGYWQRPIETEQTYHARLSDTAEGPFLRTGDLGCLVDGELYVTGRHKDLIIIRGLNHYPQDIELTVERSHSGLRPGNGAAFSVEVGGEEELVVVQEVQGKQTGEPPIEEMLSAIRTAVFEEHDLRLHAVALLRTGGVLKTSSGKIQRRAIKDAFLAGQLDAITVWRSSVEQAPPETCSSQSRGELSRDDLCEGIALRLAERSGLPVDQIDYSRPFAEFGLDSLRAVDLAEELERWLARPVEAIVFWNHPTIAALANHLVSTSSQNLATDWTTQRNEKRSEEAIAIIGMGCRFPGGVDSPDTFWTLLERGVDAIEEVPRDRWDVDAYFDPDPAAPGKMYSRHGGFVKGADEFDASFFRITPREAIELDPQQRLLLEVAWESLEHAGIAPSTLKESDTGVFIGMSSDDHAMWTAPASNLPDINPYQTLGTARSIAAGRIAYVLGLTGPVMQLDTACSSALVAVHQACQSLISGECPLAIAGGVNLMLSPATTVALCKLTALAADGRTKTFDADADGYVRGEGCGLVVLKRLSDARRDGDLVLATIAATAINHDGASNGLTAPNGAAQERLLRTTLNKAGMDSKDVAYVETHGTGTPLGDPIELEALNRVYGAGHSNQRPLYVGSVKANIGHLESAAGIAGLLKTVLMLQKRTVVRQLHFHRPNPHVDWKRMPIQVPLESRSWPEDQPLVAAVSSFGFSGTNAHLIVRGNTETTGRSKLHPDLWVESRNQSSSGESKLTSLQLFVLSARSDGSLKHLAERYIRHIEAHPEQALADICFTAATARDHFVNRLAIVASSREELLENLKTFAAGEDSSQVVLGTVSDGVQEAARKIGFLFTGQGSQYVGMGRDLYLTQPVFRSAIDRCADVLQRDFNLLLRDVMFGESSAAARLDDVEYSQPALFALQYALAELWKSWGIEPTAVLGHSAGEYSAACLAGVFPVESGLELVATRGRLIHELPQRGQMAVAMTSESRVAEFVKPFGDRISIAAINGPETIVVSGETSAVEQLSTQMRESGIDVETLNTSNAGHSILMRPMLESFRLAASRVAYAKPRLSIVSNVSGRLADGEMARGDYWVNHVCSPVRFADGMQSLAETGCRTFVELGPNPNLSAMGMGCLRDRNVRYRWLPSLTRSRSGAETMLYSLAELYVRGANVNWKGFFQAGRSSRVQLPTYAFERQSFHRAHSTSSTIASPPKSFSQLPTIEPSRFPTPGSIAQRVAPMLTGLEDDARVLSERLDAIAIRFIVEAIQNLGFTWCEGARVSKAELAKRVPPRHLVKVSRVFSRLVDGGYLQQENDEYVVKCSIPDRSAEELLNEVEREGVYPECDLIRRAGSSLAAIWRGEVEPLTFLFPDGSTDQAARFYSEARLLAGYNRLAGEVVRLLSESVPAGQPIRVLEVGAGTGGLTMHLLPQMPRDRSHYLFTDVSPLFLRAAADRFSEFPLLTTELLDISRPAGPHGFASRLGSFDLVVAANVLHATPRLHETLTHVRQLLKPNGWLLLLEGANPPLWGDMIFTLIDGWWSFEDTDLRPDYPLMRRDRWCQVLRESGFAEVESLNDARARDDSNHTLYLAQADSSTNMPAASDHSPPVTLPRSLAHPVQATIDRRGDEDLIELVRQHAAHVMRLPREAIDPSQPLADLGLDSLMAVELRTHLSRALGTDVSLNPLRMRRSIDEIVAYLRNPEVPSPFRDASRTKLSNLELDVPRVHLVPLQPLGSRTPLFFVPAGYGDLLAFQDVAHAIGADQPVYGLQPASAKQVKTIRQMSIYRLVSAYISEIKKIQPTGPYRLSGYSAGAIIAVELARELKRQGDEVSLLVIFDPPSHVPFWLDWFYSLSYRVCVQTRLIDYIRGVRSRFVRRLFHTVLDEGLRTHTTVTTEHRVASFPGRITHFRAIWSQASLVSLWPVSWFWKQIARDGTEVHWIPGTHYGMLRGSGAGVVVDELADCLLRSEKSVN